jgi:hypothetical protein
MKKLLLALVLVLAPGMMLAERPAHAGSLPLHRVDTASASELLIHVHGRQGGRWIADDIAVVHGTRGADGIDTTRRAIAGLGAVRIAGNAGTDASIDEATFRAVLSRCYCALLSSGPRAMAALGSDVATPWTRTIIASNPRETRLLPWVSTAALARAAPSSC